MQHAAWCNLKLEMHIYTLRLICWGLPRQENLLGLAPDRICCIRHSQANAIVDKDMKKCSRSNRDRMRCTFYFLTQLIKYKGIYDESLPGASLGWHDVCEEMTYPKLMLTWAMLLTITNYYELLRIIIIITTNTTTTITTTN